MKGRLALVALLAGCAGQSPPAPAASTHGDEPGATRASRETEGEVAPSEPAVGPAGYTTTDLGDAEIEDGFGGHVVARAIAVDLDGSRFSAGALDWVLHVGGRRYAEYHYVGGALRFVVEASALGEGPLYALYGDDPRRRVELVPATDAAGAVAP